MAYVDVADAVQAKLQALTSVFANSTDVTRGDYRVLDTGSQTVAVLVPGAFSAAEIAAYQSKREWVVLVDLFCRYLDDAETWSRFESARDSVIAQLELYPSLDGTTGITQVSVESDGDAVEVFDESGAGPFFVMQRLRVVVTERVGLSGGEFV
ncbi:hypothetical protein D6833_04135 [Candidatus Parcubacteria bacterium]|nr:MAG: hypothetical protein D6833_04135 [Candidatus Parcubacteria bacterium]